MSPASKESIASYCKLKIETASAEFFNLSLTQLQNDALVVYKKEGMGETHHYQINNTGHQVLKEMYRVIKEENTLINRIEK